MNALMFMWENKCQHLSDLVHIKSERVKAFQFPSVVEAC